VLQRLPHVMTVLVVITGAILWWQSTQGLQAFTWESYRRLQIERQPVAVPKVPLQDHQGRLLNIASLHGKVLVVNFIYTRCPTICGLTGMNFARLQAELAKQGFANEVRLLSISLDPEYDSPAKLRGYLQRFSKLVNGNWRLVRAETPKASRQLLQQLGVVSIPDGTGGIIHNAATHIVDQRGYLVKVIDESNLEQTLEVIKRLLSPAQKA
jgi:protein SCO1/2